MQKPKKPVFFMLVCTGIILFLILLMQPLTIIQFREYIAILFPKGSIAVEQRNLLLIIQALMLLVVVPVYILTFVFSWKYRADNPQGKYDPDLVDNKIAEFVWWGFPLIMTLIVGILTYYKTHELDPFKSIPSKNNEMTIQAIALQWKWLFIYPEEKIASLNYLHIPVETPIRFQITADAPMNSLWIPDLAGQIYAMPKMKTELNMIANEEGNFRGSSANLSGEGFAEMHFITTASNHENYHQWIESAKQSTNVLDMAEYDKLATPSPNNDVMTFQLTKEDLFDQIINKYMHP